MELPSTKLNLGDSLWSISCNKPVEWIVEAVKCFISDKCYNITYELHRANNTASKTSIDEKFVGSDYFESKQGLMAYLFGDCLTEGLVVK